MLTRKKVMCITGAVALVLATLAPATLAAADDAPPATDTTVVVVVDDSAPAEEAAPAEEVVVDETPVTSDVTDEEAVVEETPVTDEVTTEEPPVGPPVAASARFTSKKDDDEPAKITICHATNSATNPYVEIEVSINAADGVAGNSGNTPDHYGEHTGPLASSVEVAQGLKDDHVSWGDIIPAIDGVHDGLNLGDGGAEILAAGCNLPDEPECVEDPTFSYTFYGETGQVILTVSGGDEGEPLCDPLAARTAAWTYDLPASGSPSWPQTLAGFTDQLIDAIGEYDYSPPQQDSCYQYDAYAAFVSDGGFDVLGLPEHLLGSHNPSEPAFLHETLPGSGTNPTWSYTTSEGCNPPPPPVVLPPDVSTSLSGECKAFPEGQNGLGGFIDFSSSNALVAGPDPIGTSAVVEYFVNGTSVYGPVTQAPDGTVEDYTYTVPEDSGIYSATIEVDGVVVATLDPEFNSDCGTPAPTVITPAPPTVYCGVLTIPGVLDERNADGNVWVTTQVSYVYDKAAGTVTGYPKSGFVFAEPSNGDTYTLDKDGHAVWVISELPDACPPVIKPPTETPGLALTGTNIGGPLFGGISVLLVGGALVLMGIRYNRRKMVEPEAVSVTSV